MGRLYSPSSELGGGRSTGDGRPHLPSCPPPAPSPAQLDSTVNAIWQAVVAAGQANNTLILATADNGPWAVKCQYSGETAAPGMPFVGAYQAQLGGGSAFKDTTWEGGQREFGLAHWQGAIAPGQVCDGGEGGRASSGSRTGWAPSRPGRCVMGGGGREDSVLLWLSLELQSVCTTPLPPAGLARDRLYAGLAAHCAGTRGGRPACRWVGG